MNGNVIQEQEAPSGRRPTCVCVREGRRGGVKFTRISDEPYRSTHITHTQRDNPPVCVRSDAHTTHVGRGAKCVGGRGVEGEVESKREGGGGIYILRYIYGQHTYIQRYDQSVCVREGGRDGRRVDSSDLLQSHLRRRLLALVACLSIGVSAVQ